MIIRTVLGDITPEAAGVTYAHEHLIIDSALVTENWPHISLPSVEEATAETDLCVDVGVRTMVDTMPVGSGGHPARLAAVSEATGVNIVAATGMHTLKYYAGSDWTSETVESLADRFVDDIRRQALPCGVIKLATSGDRPTSFERLLFTAGAEAHHRTGAPIITHCEEGHGGLDQIEMLTGLGVDPGRVILSHTDKVTDMGYHTDLFATGVNLVYDQALRQVEGPYTTAALIGGLAEFIPQMLLGTDGARRTLWSSLGGSPGLAWLASSFPSVLATHGIGPGEVEMMFVANPARALAFA